MNFDRLTHWILGKKTYEEKYKERLKFVKELLMTKQLIATTPQEHARNIADQFYVDSIVVSNGESELLNLGGNGKTTHLKDILAYVRGKLPETQMILIKDNDKYNVVYPHEGMVYNLETPGEISHLETKRFAERIHDQLVSK